MALSVSGLYTHSLPSGDIESSTGLNSSTPSPTHPYNGTIPPASPSLSSAKVRQPPAADLPLHSSRSPPPSVARPQRSESVGAINRPRGQSASSRPSLRLHIANPSDPPPTNPRSNPTTKSTHAQEQAVRSTIQALQAQAQAQQSGGALPPFKNLYPSSVMNSVEDISNRKRGETFSDFSGGSAHSADLHAVISRSASPPNIRITTANLNLTALAASAQQSSTTFNSTPSSGSASSAASRTKRARAPPAGPPMPGSGNISSASTASTSIFTDDQSTSASCASTPASSECHNAFGTTRMEGAPRNRPLPVPPPAVPTLSAIPPRVASPNAVVVTPPPPPPLQMSVPPSRSMTPSTPSKLAQGHSYGSIGHGHSSSSDLDASASSASRAGKKKGKGKLPARSGSESPVDVEEIPYELRSEKWKGKQRARDSMSSNGEAAISPPFGGEKWSGRQAVRGDAGSGEEVGLPPSLSTRASRTSLASSHSSTRSGGVSEGGVSKWKGKGKETLRPMSISSVSSVEREPSTLSKWKGKGKEVARRSGSVSSINHSATSLSTIGVAPPHQNTIIAKVSSHVIQSPQSRSHSPSLSPAPSPIISSLLPSQIPLHAPVGHPGALIPGYQSIGSPQADMRSTVRSTSPRAAGLDMRMWSPPQPVYIEPLSLRKATSPTSPALSPQAPRLPPKDARYMPKSSQHSLPVDEDSDEEGKRLYKEVEAMYSAQSDFSHRLNVPHQGELSKSPDADRPIDVGYGYAESGYEDDERVYVDDGYDDPNNPDLEDLEFGVSAAGHLVGGGGMAGNIGNLGQPGPTIAVSRPSSTRERERSPSPMRYARPRRDSLFDDDSDGLSPVNLLNAGRPEPQSGRDSPGVDGFVFIDSRLPSPLSPPRPLSPLTFSDGKRGRRSRPLGSVDILGDESEISFAKNPSPTRRHPMKGIYAVGSISPLTEERVYVRGKWRMRSPSPTGVSPVSPVSGAPGNPRNKSGPGLRRYASEESLLSAGMGMAPSEMDGRTEIHSGVGGMAPLRSSGFEEFNLTPNRFIDRSPTPDSVSYEGRNSSRKSLSSQEHGSSGRQTPLLRGPGTKPAGYQGDYGLGSQWKAASEFGREAGRSRRDLGRGVFGNESGEKLKKHRGKSLTRSEAKEVQRGGSSVSSHQSHDRQVSYDIWVEQGIHPPVKTKRSNGSRT